MWEIELIDVFEVQGSRLNRMNTPKFLGAIRNPVNPLILKS
jgi:hypothetical protein